MYRNKILLSSLCIAIIILLIVLSIQNKFKDNPPPFEGSGLSIIDNSGKAVDGFTVTMDKDKVFDYIYQIINSSNQQKTYKISTLINNSQRMMKIDGVDYMVYTKKVEKNSAELISIEMDLSDVVYKNNNLIISISEDSSTNLFDTNYVRYNLIMDYNIQTAQYKPIETDYMNSEHRFIGVHLSQDFNRSENIKENIENINAKPLQEIRIALRITPDDSLNEPSIGTFWLCLNEMQTQVNNEAYLHINNQVNKTSFTNISFISPKEKGEYEIYGCYSSNSNELLTGNNLFKSQVYSSNKIKLIVK